MSTENYKIFMKESHTFKYELGHAIATSQNISCLESILRSAKESFKFAYDKKQLTEAEYKDILNDFYTFVKDFDLPIINSLINISETEDWIDGDWVVSVP